jgi:putative transposase
MRTVQNKLSDTEKAEILGIVCTPEFRDQSPDKIVPMLAQRNIYIASERTIYRVLSDANLQKHRRREKVSKANKPRELAATGPGQVWSWDVTYLPSKVLGKYFYCYVFMDIFSRKIVDWNVHDCESGVLASQLLRSSCLAENIDLNQLSLHQDNGAIMRGAEFTQTMSILGVQPSYSRPGVSDDNPFSESLFKTLKYRTWYPETPFCNVEDSRAWMTRFVGWYNDKHLHSSLKFVTPSERHRGEDVEILRIRDETYKQAQSRTPNRFANGTRNWIRQSEVILNPEKAA